MLGLSVEWVAETGLAGNMWKEDMERMRFAAETNALPRAEAKTSGRAGAPPTADQAWIVSLRPMEIRTFIMKVVYN
jgi:hypothetical protein